MPLAFRQHIVCDRVMAAELVLTTYIIYSKPSDNNLIAFAHSSSPSIAYYEIMSLFFVPSSSFFWNLYRRVVISKLC